MDVHNFGRKPSHRRAMFAGMLSALVQKGRVCTTLAKALELRRVADRAVTQAKRGVKKNANANKGDNKDTIHARRLLLSKGYGELAVSALMDKLAKDFSERPGGYTRTLKLGPRPGDKAPMALVEWVNYQAPEKKLKVSKAAQAGADADGAKGDTGAAGDGVAMDAAGQVAAAGTGATATKVLSRASKALRSSRRRMQRQSRRTNRR